MGMFFIFILLTLISTSLYSEQMLRETWEYGSDNKILYRISNEKTLAEATALTDPEGVWSPGPFILDSRFFQLGSFAPSGLWKFTSLTSLISNTTLRQKHGLVADRSSNSFLESSAAALLFPCHGGLMVQRDEMSIQSAVWQELYLNPYNPLTLGISLGLPEASDDSEEKDDSWFNDGGPEDVHPVYHGAADLKHEGRRSRVHIQGGGSFSEYRIPGYSLLPVYSLIEKSWDFTSRYWINSAHWVNRDLEVPLWERYWENRINVLPDIDFQISGIFYQGYKWDESRSFLGFSLQGERTFDPGGIRLGYALDTVPEEGGMMRTSEYSIKLSRRRPVWSASLEGRLRGNAQRVLEWSIGPELKRFRQGRYSRLFCPVKAEPGILTVSPQGEESLRIGSFRLTGKGGYEFRNPSQKGFSEESLIMRLQLEWSR
jgi:hypothetical protein